MVKSSASRGSPSASRSVRPRRRAAQPPARGDAPGVGPALRDSLAAAEHSVRVGGAASEGAGAADAAHLIDLELVVLLEGRRYFLDWVEDLRGERESAEPSAPRATGASSAGNSPAQFLRAWSDSTARVIQLLKARQALSAADDGSDALLLEVVAELERSPGLLVDSDPADAAGEATDDPH